MALTAHLLTEIPECGSKIIAGHGGQYQPIAWAHSCEEPEPWNWLGATHLVMTTGLAIPADAAGQRRYVEECSAHGIVGVAIGQNMNAPKLTEAFLTRANELAFIVILTQREIPFIVLSRAIADSEQRNERERLQRSNRLYEAVLLTTVDHSKDVNRLELVGATIGYNVSIINDYKQEDASEPIDDKKSHTAQAASDALELPIPGFPQALVRLTPQEPQHNPLEQGIRQHISLIAALELQQKKTEREKAYRQSAALLSSFIDGVETKDVEQRTWAMLDFENQSYYIAIGNRISNGIRLFHELLDAGFRSAVYPQGQTTHILCSATTEALEIVNKRVQHLGVSNSIRSVKDVRTGLGQAQLAHQSAVERQMSVVYFRERKASIVPNSAPDADLLIEQTLSQLLQHDKQHGSEYVRSLRVFLEENRSWNVAADKLHVHKQTLVYRMRRVTEMSGLRLDQTADVALFWAALEALDVYR